MKSQHLFSLLDRSVVPLLVVVFVTCVAAGCGTFETVKRSDGTSARLLRDFDKAWPTSIKSAELTFKPSITHPSGVEGNVLVEWELSRERLYQEMDQYNATLRHLLVWYYLMYQNGELDDQPYRQQYRAMWIDVSTTLLKQSLEYRSRFEQELVEAVGPGRSGVSHDRIDRWQSEVLEKTRDLMTTAREATRRYIAIEPD